MNIIDDITSARDKSVPIKKLHDLILANPDIDVHAYLQRISSAFRKFVIDALTKLDDGKALVISAEKAASKPPQEATVLAAMVSDELSAELNANSTVHPSPILSSTTTASLSERVASSNMADISGGSEAMRIIEGLRQKAVEISSVTETTDSQSTVVGVPSIVTSAEPNLNGPLARVTDNIPRSTRIATPSRRSQMNEKIRGSLSSLTSSLEASAGAAGDTDLAARLSRLRNITKTAPAGTATISPPSNDLNEMN